jgi:oxygen-independent coproporphyrinogen-3 oxidase
MTDKPLFNQMFEGYAYSYPHKHSYRRMEPVLLEQLWASEKKDALFLYIHLPFCEMRCGFCNLFTIANPQENIVDAYLNTLELQAKTIRRVIKPESFAQIAIGGGTPTFLELPQLEKLFSIMRLLGAEPKDIPVSFEMSPKTVTPQKLKFLEENGVDRVSIGIQSFLDGETKALGRPQKNKEVEEALNLIRQYQFSTLNLDLIYGTYGQTPEAWHYSLEQAVSFKPEEIFIYPLYVRALTGINKLDQNVQDLREDLYLLAKKFLIEAGYEQISMRLFRLKTMRSAKAATNYSCQEDGMIGLGAGARSYTKHLHYSSEYAVARGNIKNIINDYIAKSSADFEYIDYGIELLAEEQKRRFVIKSILHASALDMSRYESLYGNQLLSDFPQLDTLLQNKLAAIGADQKIRLTSQGTDYSDAIGPWLYSGYIKELIQTFELK